LPAVCIAVLLRQHRLHGHVGAGLLLCGYVRGLAMRVAFMAMAAGAGTMGWPWALGLGLLAACGWELFTRSKVPPRSPMASVSEHTSRLSSRVSASC
jgi:hypothetical protein